MAKLSEFEFNNQKSDNVSEEELKNKFEQYKDMSKEQLNSQLFSEVARQKMEGSFDYEKLAGMVENLRGALPEQDYNNIKRILESLKWI